MRRLFYKGILADTVEITGSDAHHLMHVMRAKAGQEIILVDDENQVARMEMTAFREDAVTLTLLERLEADTESPIDLVLAQCLLKSDKMDMVVQKAVELGAVGVIPVRSQNCVVRYDAKKAAARQQRWQKIADEAAKQCGRTALLAVDSVTDIKALIAAEKECEDSVLVFFYENEDTQTVKEYLRQIKSRRIVLLVGPEGGFSLDEAKAVEEAGGKSVTLGPRILRAETAALTAMSVVQYECGDLG
ncbi:16S rRNA (uracil(1498)-N(3))-methyltransferase [Selenomonas caprae]|uniref:Ribosomal RNA small subunit methyltransferase E n=1 Tax=Selenomonas caprae TaxID=2606905 RepID=A0A5D6WH38_9FIRM|nr:16S rRNA (uracil(1498)-N(3))-methyltransferase [Selenomonas caprae]TYZ27220.1 16S rRNA (uracil(1498)-N(3))-methyltransferase [Selenomonas caprae]